MADASNRQASLRAASSRPDVRGWAVVGADGQKVGEVRGLWEDPDGRSRFLEVELDQTTLAQHLPPSGEGRITAGAYPADPHRPGSRPLADVDPSVGESERTAFYNTGARQHAAGFTGAVPRDDDREGGSGRLEHPRVLIPWDAARLKEKDEQVVLETLRGADLAELPVYAPAAP
ncbi:MAG TPA: hypothetical protein VGG03_24850 [Thermoanaerobaculia bacterium]|jgi:hypothetical protein